VTAATDRPRSFDRVKAIRFHEWIAGLLFLATAAASSWAWFGLALACGFPWQLAWVPAAALDLGEIYFGTNWISGRTEALRTWGMITAIVALIVSVAGNSAEHAIEVHMLLVTLPIVLVVGAVPVLILFGVGHQLSLDMHSPIARRRPLRTGATSAPGAGSRGAPTSPGSTVATVVALDKAPHGRTRRDLIRAYMRAHPDQRPAEVIKGMRAQGIEVPMKEAAQVYKRLNADRVEATA